MLKLIIEDDEGRKTVVPFVRDEITVGRQEGNTIRLTERNVSRKHARLLRQNGHVVVEDLGSYNGIRVNGEKIEGKHQVHDGDLIQIGDYDLAIQSEGASAERPTPQSAPAVERATMQNAEPVTETAAETAEPDSEDGEPTSPTGDALGADARRQSTAVIRVDQIESNRKREVLDIDASEAPRLVVLNTEFAGREFSCIRSELKIGRTEDNDIGIDHRSLSRTHAKIVRENNGEWRVIDMQSANGTAINGETYAQASLRSGDVITLGHVKLKFVAAGESFRFVAGKDYEKEQGGKKEAPAPAGSNKTGLYISGAIAFAALVGAAVFMMTRPPAVEPKNDEVVAVKPPVTDEPKKEDDVQPVKQEDEPKPQIAGMDEKIAAAKQAMDAREFDKAADILNSIKGSDGVRPKQVESLLDEVNAEILFKKNIAAAEKAYTSGKLDEASRLVEESGGTLAYAEELQKLKTKIEGAKQKAEDKEAAAQKKEEEALARQQALEAKKKEAEESRVADEEKRKEQLALAQKRKEEAAAKTVPAKASKTEEAKKLYEEGFNVLKSKQYAEAASIFRRCLEQDPRFAKCHLYLGVSYAKLKQVEKGAYHYKQFVTLAPNDEETPKVRKLIEQYEQSKKTP